MDGKIDNLMFITTAEEQTIFRESGEAFVSS